MNSKPSHPSQAKGGARTIVVALLVLTGLSALPVMALFRLHWDFRWIGIYGLVINAFTYWSYARDKERAEAGEWRISERALHLTELLGGWPAALLAQRRLRHKCSKGSYQFVFWLIVMAYQFAAYDSLQNWQFSRVALNQVEAISAHHQ
ncbi:MAG TPA: DUF1294 domain-containing protein [Verrucomicrobiae bacterium]|nr:DUF1294 domain-containing protein [Verrucomicrobiae bacterium]